MGKGGHEMGGKKKLENERKIVFEESFIGEKSRGHESINEYYYFLRLDGVRYKEKKRKGNSNVQGRGGPLKTRRVQTVIGL